MIDSFPERQPSLQSPAQDGKLLRLQGPGGKLLERAEGYAICLAQGAIDGAGFGHAHFGVVENEGGAVAGMSVPITHEAPALG
jgi:hypothetical protein